MNLFRKIVGVLAVVIAVTSMNGLAVAGGDPTQPALNGVTFISPIVADSDARGLSANPFDRVFAQAQVDAFNTYHYALKSGTPYEMATFVYSFNLDTARQSCLRSGGMCG